MARRIEHRTRSDWGVPVVYRTLIDPEYLRERLKVLGGHNAALLEHEVTTDGARYRLRHGVAGEDLPGVLGRLLGDSITVDRQESWRADSNGDYSGTVRVTIAGTPGDMSGTQKIVADGDGSVRSVEGSVRIPIPLIGGAVEENVARQVTDLLTKESDFTDDWLRPPQG